MHPCDHWIIRKASPHAHALVRGAAPTCAAAPAFCNERAQVQRAQPEGFHSHPCMGMMSLASVGSLPFALPPDGSACTCACAGARGALVSNVVRAGLDVRSDASNSHLRRERGRTFAAAARLSCLSCLQRSCGSVAGPALDFFFLASFFLAAFVTAPCVLAPSLFPARALAFFTALERTLPPLAAVDVPPLPPRTIFARFARFPSSHASTLARSLARRTTLRRLPPAAGGRRAGVDEWRARARCRHRRLPSWRRGGHLRFFFFSCAPARPIACAEPAWRHPIVQNEDSMCVGEMDSFLDGFRVARHIYCTYADFG